MTNDTLYKYISLPDGDEKKRANILDSILSGNLKFSTLSELNDPAELFPRTNADDVVASFARLKLRPREEISAALVKQGKFLQKVLKRPTENLNIDALMSRFDSMSHEVFCSGTAQL